MFPLDNFVMDGMTKKPLQESQKPVSFFESLVGSNTVSGEWILNGFSGIGMGFSW